MDPQAAQALKILRRHVETSPDRRLAKALACVARQLTDAQPEPPRTNRCEIVRVTRSAEPDDERLEPDDVDLEPDAEDPDDAVMGDLIEAALSTGTIPLTALKDCPSVEPLARQTYIVETAIQRAREAGLQLPAFAVAWRDGRGQVPRGTASRDAGVITVYLNAYLDPDALREVTYHELQHCADFSAWTRWTRRQREMRAVKFARRMMESS